MRFINKVINRIKIVLVNMIWAFRSIVWKRDKEIILCGSWFGERFADTSRYLYQFLYENQNELGLKKVVWVTRSEHVLHMMKELGYEVYLMDSKESIHYHKKAGYHIISNFSNNNSIYKSDILCKYSFGAVRINLWHGVMPMKGVGAAAGDYKKNQENHPTSSAIKEWLLLHCKIYRILFVGEGGWGDCYYLSTTSAGTEIMKQFFILPETRFIETANPRVCSTPILTTEEQEIKEIMSRYKYVALYLPTFREKAKGFDYAHMAEPLQDFFDEQEMLWIQKSHSADEKAVDAHQILGNILYLSSDFDINIIMPEITLLITDYSSVAADAMYYWKPVLYYMPDYEEYMSADRGFVINPQDVMCGPMVKTTEELMANILETIKNSNNFKASAQYSETRHKYWGDEKTMFNIWLDLKSATGDKIRRNVK